MAPDQMVKYLLLVVGEAAVKVYLNLVAPGAH